MVWPVVEQLRRQGKAHAAKAHEHGALPRRIDRQQAAKLGAIEAGPARRQAHGPVGDGPIHRHGEGTFDHRRPLAVGLESPLRPAHEGPAHGPVDGIPAKVADPDQGGRQGLGQGRRRRGHIAQHQNWFSLASQPGRLPVDLAGQLLLEGV